LSFFGEKPVAGEKGTAEEIEDSDGGGGG